jgi:dTDP-4-dehydrorhamnose reductase
VRIVLTGPTGQVGSALSKTRAGKGEVIALDRKQLDLQKPDVAVIRIARPEVIINAAAYTAVDQAEDEPDLAHAVNAVAPGILAEEAKRAGALLVHFSTDYVFDGEKSTPYVEEDAPNPLNVYGRTKLAGEEAIRASGCRHLILRTSWVYAPTGRNFLKAILSQTKPLRVVNDQFGAPTSNLMLARAVSRLVEKGGEGLYHLTAAGKTSWHGFASAALPGRQIEAVSSSEYPVKARRPRNSVLDNAKIVRELGIRLPSWQEGLREVMEQMR